MSPIASEFDLKSAAAVLPRSAAAQVSVDGHFLYGAPASNLELEGAVTIDAAKERPGFAGYSFGPFDDEVTAIRQDLADLPATDASGKSSFPVKLDKLPSTSRPLQAQITVSMAESGGRAVERKLTLPIAADAAAIGVKPAFSGLSLADGANADFDVVLVAPDGKGRWRAAACATSCSRSTPATNGIGATASGSSNRSSAPSASPIGTLDVAADKPGRLSLPVKWGRYRLEVSSAEPNGTLTSQSFDGRLLCRVECRYAGPPGSRARQDRL